MEKFERTTSCQKTCYNYKMSHGVGTPPSDCPGLIEVRLVRGAAGEGGGYECQICPKISERGKNFRHIMTLPDKEPHTIVINAFRKPTEAEYARIAEEFDKDPRAELRLRYEKGTELFIDDKPWAPE